MAQYEKQPWAQKRRRADGRWQEILEELCSGMFTEAWSNLGNHVDCPIHGGKGDFRIPKTPMQNWDNPAHCGVACCTCFGVTDGFGLVALALNVPRKEAVKAVFDYLDGANQDNRVKPVVPAYTPPSDAEKAKEDQDILDQVQKLWSSARPLTKDCPVLAYYKERKLDEATLDNLVSTGNVRWMPALGYYDDNREKVGSFPVLLAALRNKNGDIVALHRTWLSKSYAEKAPVKKAKKLTRTTGASGSAIRLHSQTEAITCLGLAEGIETAMAAWQLARSGHFAGLSEMPVWACYSAGNIAAFQLPESIAKTLETIVVFADNDENGTGERSANELKTRIAKFYPKVNVLIKVPAVQGNDFNDELINVI